MGLFSRKKQQQGNISKYSLNTKDKKTRKYFEEQFGSVAKKDDFLNLVDYFKWAEKRNRVDSIPFKKRKRMLEIMWKRRNELEPNVRANLERYVNEKWGVKVEK